MLKIGQCLWHTFWDKLWISSCYWMEVAIIMPSNITLLSLLRASGKDFQGNHVFWHWDPWNLCLSQAVHMAWERKFSSKWMDFSLITFSVLESPILNWCCEIERKQQKGWEGKVRITFHPLCQSSSPRNSLHTNIFASLYLLSPGRSSYKLRCPMGGIVLFIFVCDGLWIDWAKERERHHTNRIPGTGFFCDSFPHERPLRGQVHCKERSNPAGLLYKICDEDCLAWLRHSIFTSTALRHFAFVFLLLLI